VKGRNQRIAGSLALEKAADARFHLVRRFVGKRDGENRVGPDVQVIDQVRDTVRNDARLSAAGAGKDEDGSVRSVNGLELLRIEKLAEIHGIVSRGFRD
jgi:hypothetical protein